MGRYNMPVKVFDFQQMVSWVANYFREKKQEVEESCTKQGMKVHVYAKKEKNNKIIDEIFVEVTVSSEIPKLLIGDNLYKENEDEEEIVGVLTHFQAYFHPSKIFLAIPYYAQNIDEIKKLCEWEGIGLLKVNNDGKVKELLPAFNRMELFKDIIDEKIKDHFRDHGIKKRNELINKIGDLADSILYHRAVTTFVTPPPSYQMNLSRNLLEKMSNLKDDVIYKDDILEFCNKYLTQRKDDYDIVVECVKSLWKNHLDFPKISSSFDFYEKFENILKLDKDYRDHFLHQFQVFLLGTLIINGILLKFCKVYKETINNVKKEDIFKTWLIASTFHDFAYPLERYSKWNDELFNKILNIKPSPTVMGFEKITTEKNFLEYLDQIDHLLLCYNSTGKKWCCRSPHTTNENLRRFFLNKIVEERNHGLLSSLALLKKSETEKKIDKDTTEKIIYPAAVGIAIHDEGVWQPFRGRKPSWRKKSPKWEQDFMKLNYLNHLDFSIHPLSFLLIYCDTAQEFGRPKFPELKDVSSPTAQFEDLIIEKNKIQIIISVATTKEYTKKETELNGTTDFLKSSDIEFIFRLMDKEKKTGKDFPVTS
jgi:hypothetical protein